MIDLALLGLGWSQIVSKQASSKGRAIRADVSRSERKLVLPTAWAQILILILALT